MATTLVPRPTVSGVPITPTSSGSVSSTSGTSSSSTRSASSSPSSSTTSTPTPTLTLSSSSTTLSSSSSFPSSASTSADDSAPSGTLVIHVPDASDQVASAPATRPKAPTQNIVIAVLSAIALFALAAAAFFAIRLWVRRRHARTHAADPEWRASMVHRHSSNGSRAALWGALGTTPGDGSDESAGMKGTYGGPIPVERGTLRGGQGRRRHTSLLTDTPDEPPAHGTPQWPFFAMPQVPSPTAMDHHQQPGMSYVQWAVPSTSVGWPGTRPLSVGRSPPPPPGTIAFPPLSSPASPTLYAAGTSGSHIPGTSQTHDELMRALDVEDAVDLATPASHPVPAPPPSALLYSRRTSITPQTIGAWIAGAGNSSATLAPAGGSSTAGPASHA